MALQARKKNSEPLIIVSSNAVILRDALFADVESYVRWMNQGEWQQYDAPWEIEYLFRDEHEVRKMFSERYMRNLSSPRSRAIIATQEHKPLGSVNRYVEERFPDAWFIGINICEDDYLNKGIGTEALKLWVDYLFAKSNIHRIGLATYSFNPRMIRVAEKLGFTHEGTDREIIRWHGEWVDRLHFGVLRNEWRGPG
jgi:RimJ/RimL family protein N-acetyltransferase